MSLIRAGVTLRAFAKELTDILIGSIYSSRRISPGWMGRILFLTMTISLFSMIIHDLDIPSICIFPSKANPPTIIDSDAPLSRSIALKFLKLVAGGRVQKAKRCGSIQLCQLAFCLTLKNLPSLWAMPGVEGLRVFITKRFYHLLMLYR
jgi:hypothetical protein